MDSERRRRIEQLFQTALDKTPSEREELLRREESDDSIRAEVLSLIDHHDAGADLFQFTPGSLEPDPERIGSFAIVSRLGEGGMGIVYLAEQSEPVRRTVALELVRAGLGSGELLRRFATEQDALARLEHPNVARLYEAGQSADGQPFFAMEYVDGVPITHYCDERRLTALQRIELLTQACRGIQEAHQNGIIHRDLKPSNILVTEKDGVAIPKIIDFGVAKALDVHQRKARQFTRFGQLVGTPEYMSPEQAAGLSVDTRSDVYSLGVVLYELLSGVLPLDASSIREEGFEAMMRLIRESEPVRPSTRVSSLGGAASDAATRRRTNPRNLARQLRGELDWIALRALEKERDRRYATVTEFAADLQAHLNDEPVRARPATFAYQLRKFARRNRLAVSLASVAAVALLLFAVGMTVQAQRIANERDRAKQKTEVAEEVKAFLVDLFESSDPAVAQGDTVSARDLLDRGVQRVDEIEDPRVRAELLGALSHVQSSLGNRQARLQLNRRSYETFVALDGAISETALGELNNMGSAYLGLGKYAVAESLYTECIEGWRALDDLESGPALDAVQNLAMLQLNRGRYHAAEAQLLEAERLRMRILGDEDPKLFLIRSALAQVYHRQERHERELEILERLVEDQRRLLGENHPDVILSMCGLAGVYTESTRYDEAQALLEETVGRGRVVWGDAHPDYQYVREQLALFYYSREEYAEAEPIFQALADSSRSQLGDDHPNTLTHLHNLGALYGNMGRFDLAESVFQDVLASRVRILGNEHPYTQGTRFSLALLAAQRGNLDTALDLLRTAIEGGFTHSIIVEVDESSDFAGLIGNPEFERLREIVRARMQDD